MEHCYSPPPPPPWGTRPRGTPVPGLGLVATCRAVVSPSRAAPATFAILPSQPTLPTDPTHTLAKNPLVDKFVVLRLLHTTTAPVFKSPPRALADPPPQKKKHPTPHLSRAPHAFPGRLAAPPPPPLHSYGGIASNLPFGPVPNVRSTASAIATPSATARTVTPVRSTLARM